MSADAATLTIARLARFLETRPSELSLPQYRVLGKLALGDERASRLASQVSIGKSTLTALVDSLVERGLVTRSTALGDRRAVRLSITPAGRTLLATTGAGLRDGLDEVLARCDDPAAALAALDDLRQALDRRWTERAAARDKTANGTTPADATR